MGYNIFRKLFKTEKVEQEAKQEDTVTQVFSLFIVADDEGFLNIDCEWDAGAANIHEVIADTFFSMDEGKVAAMALSMIASNINGMDVEESQKDEFIAKIIVEYARLSAESKANSEHPVVSPIDVFKLE
jgi:hypothetical protein